jgi:hypothetical protein
MRDRASDPTLYELARPFPAHLIEKPPQGKFGTYVPHFVVTQALLAYTGPYDWRLVEILRGSVPGTTTKDGTAYPQLTDAIVGVVGELTVNIDGGRVTIQEAGSCESPAFDNNDGERLKKAASDAIKRCAMRVGLGLHLWCKRGDQYFLSKVLRGVEEDITDDTVTVAGDQGDE